MHVHSSTVNNMIGKLENLIGKGKMLHNVELDCGGISHFDLYYCSVLYPHARTNRSGSKNTISLNPCETAVHTIWYSRKNVHVDVYL